MALTEIQQKYVELEKKKAEIKQYYEDLKAATEALVAEQGAVNFYFQDDDGTVYKVVEPSGKFVYFEKYEVLRTRREGEKAGTLSLKEAKEAGFNPVQENSKQPEAV